MKNFTISLLLLAVFACIPAVAMQKQKDEPYSQWLDKKHVGHKMNYGEKGKKESHSVNYLGDVTNLKKETFKIVSVVFTDSQKHDTCKLLVFNEHNALLGGYGFTSASDLPTSVHGNRLIFDYKLGKNPCQEITKVDFMHGIPPRLFVACRGAEASIYEFYADMKG